MPIKIPDNLPAAKVLASENIFTMNEERAVKQDIRPLQIGILNLMPNKITTETQLSRLLGNTPLQVEIELVQVSSHKSKNVSAEHMLAFYKTFDEIKHRKFDGFLITGAPVEKLPYNEVNYWDELCEIMEWTKTNVHSTFHICWGAQAALYYHYGIEKHLLPKKLSGVYSHTVSYKNSMLLRGFDDVFYVPHSRHTTIDMADVAKHPEIKILACSEDAGLYAASTDGGRQIFITGHSEYDPNTLRDEYLRDCDAGLNPEIPQNYFPEDDITKPPLVRWRGHANLIYSNWLNYYVYQNTPYDITTIK